jgi:hypothetical protein
MLDLADEEARDVVALAARADVDDLSRLFQGFSRAFDEIVRSGQPRTALEMALVRLARRPPLLPLDELLSRLGDLEKRLGGQPPPGPAPRGGPGGGGGGGGGGGRTVGTPASEPSRVPCRLDPPAPPRSHGALALVVPQPATGGREIARPGARERARCHRGARRRPRSPAPSERAIVDWRVLARCGRKAHVASVFEHAVPLELNGRRVTRRIRPERELLRGPAPASPSRWRRLTARDRAITFRRPRKVAVDLSARPGPSLKTVASIDAAEADGRAGPKAHADGEGHPLVQEGVRLFGAQLKRREAAERRIVS